ncbi:Fic family protein [Mucilaginibacter mali]|uniref:Fic family protein n=1 Tax=Mucilaginibacter mali TaxID=2740462 RepID=A0A7D4PSY8_9SPHI|nr:Fic family protein [Mucilaginibacter mali]QKJ29243.1 Fic family protein [Mucilaginibacter mali]
MYIHQSINWPNFKWKAEVILPVLGEVRHREGRIIGQMNALGFKIRESTLLDTLTRDVTKSSEIEGEMLNVIQVRSSIARRLGISIIDGVASSREVDGVVEMMLDATQKFDRPLTSERLFGWHDLLFPSGRSGMQKITVGKWRTAEAGPMQVVSGPMGREIVHFEAPEAERLTAEMEQFIRWINHNNTNDAVIKAAIAHLWFVTIHPFDDGNGRITRALTDMLLARADGIPERFYSMSAQILKERNDYYQLLEKTQKGGMDITAWLLWFLKCLNRAMDHTEETIAGVTRRNEFWKKFQDVQLNERQRHMIVTLLDSFFGKLTSGKWAKMNKCSADTALRDIQDLINKGVLIKESPGGRSTNYVLNWN